jgi:hypothetical protein
MLSDDYLVRMIMQFAAVMAKIAGLKMAGQYPEALEEIDQALGQLLGMDTAIINLLDDESLERILTVNGQIDIKRLGALAELLMEEGNILELMNRKSECMDSFARSLNYYLMIMQLESTPPIEVPAKIDELTKKINNSDLPLKTLLDLFCFYENEGQIIKAEKILDTLVESDAPVDVRQERISFYERLLKMDHEVLIGNGISRKEIQKKLKMLG